MSTIITPEMLGWHRDDEAVDAFTSILDASGTPARFGAAQVPLLGYWKTLTQRGTAHVLAQTYEKIVFGKFLPPDLQRRGTCVGRGTYYAGQCSFVFELANNLALGRQIILAFEPIYGGSRVTIGRGQLGRGDGSVGAWAAEFLWRYGMMERAMHGSTDLRTAREDLAVAWGEPNAGPPQHILELCKQHPMVCHRVYTMDELADAIAAGYFGSYCSNIIWGDRDRNGMAVPESSGGHCEAVSGVFLSPSGELCFQRQQSWGLLPNGPTTLATKSGPIQLKPGSYGAYAQHMQRGLDQGGECWVFKPKRHFRAQTVKEIAS